jgi:hypothetical protein
MSVLHKPKSENKKSSLVYFGFGRLLIGTAAGLYTSVVPTYSTCINKSLVNEIAPKHLTGMLGSCHQLFVTIAVMFSSLVGYSLPDDR